MGQCMTEYFPASRTRKFTDGFHDEPVHGRRPLDPHCFVPRLHTAKGRGDQSFWAIRRIVDHQNLSSKRIHRSTMAVNACDELIWAWDQDLESIIRVAGFDAAVDDDEIRFDFAGYLPTLTGKNKRDAQAIRGIRALNIAKRGGHVTDNGQTAQLWHVLHLAKPAGPGSTVSGCGVTARGLLALRGDVEYAIGSKLAHFVFVDFDFGLPKGPRRLKGFIYIGKRGPFGPASEMALDESSNQKVLERQLNKGLRVVVFDEIEWVPVPTPKSGPPQYPDTPTPSDNPKYNNIGAFDVDTFEATGNDVRYYTEIPIPLTIRDQEGLNLSLNFLTPSGAFTGDVDVRIDYVVFAIGDDASPGAVTDRIITTLNSTTSPGSQKLRSTGFFIPHSDIKDAPGGKIAIAFYRSGSDDQLDDLDVIFIDRGFGPRVTGFALPAVPP